MDVKYTKGREKTAEQNGKIITGFKNLACSSVLIY